MGKEARLKEVRKQLRNIVKENIDEILTKELVINLKSDLTKQVDAISNYTKVTLEAIDKRNQDLNSYVVRQLAGATPALNATPEQLSEAAPLPPVATE